MPRVPIQGLTNIVPPQDPDQVPASTNNLSTSPLAAGMFVLQYEAIVTCNAYMLGNNDSNLQHMIYNHIL